jgi:hypothetical protein
MNSTSAARRASIRPLKAPDPLSLFLKLRDREETFIAQVYFSDAILFVRGYDFHF